MYFKILFILTIILQFLCVYQIKNCKSKNKLELDLLIAKISLLSIFSFLSQCYLYISLAIENGYIIIYFCFSFLFLYLYVSIKTQILKDQLLENDWNNEQNKLEYILNEKRHKLEYLLNDISMDEDNKILYNPIFENINKSIKLLNINSKEESYLNLETNILLLKEIKENSIEKKKETNDYI